MYVTLYKSLHLDISRNSHIWMYMYMYMYTIGAVCVLQILHIFNLVNWQIFQKIKTCQFKFHVCTPMMLHIQICQIQIPNESCFAKLNAHQSYLPHVHGTTVEPL